MKVNYATQTVAAEREKAAKWAQSNPEKSRANIDDARPKAEARAQVRAEVQVRTQVLTQTR